MLDKKIAIISCSNANLEYFDHDYDIKIFRSSVHLGDESYLDHIEINADDFYKRLEEDKSIFPSTSFMPLGKMIEIYENLVKEGYTHAIVITISKQMSGIFNAALMAGNEVDDLEVKVFDSKTLAYPQAKMALKAAEMVKEGYDIPDIEKELLYIRDNNKIYFAVNTLTYLVKNGRLSNASGFIGNALKLKPVLTIDDGKVVTVEKIRTFKKAVEHVLDLYFEETKDKNVEPFVIHANNPEIRDYMISRMKENDNELKDIFSMPLTAGIGAHSGPKTIGIGYYIKK
ncbi:MAG: DegV domain-containing protein [Candidatus Izimaplasma bacterium HR2]|nr:MAG: DegV domain-containing protein [Candidatus Izimaplasma bacterium HR2]